MDKVAVQSQTAIVVGAFRGFIEKRMIKIFVDIVAFFAVLTR